MVLMDISWRVGMIQFKISCMDGTDGHFVESRYDSIQD